MRTVDVFSIDLLLLMKLFSLTLSRITSLVFPILDVIWFIKRHGSLIGNSLLCSLMVMYVSVSSSIRTRHGLCYQWFCWLTFLGFSNVFLRSFSYWSFSVGHCIDLNPNVSLLLRSLLSTLSVILHNNQKAYYRLSEKNNKVSMWSCTYIKNWETCTKNSVATFHPSFRHIIRTFWIYKYRIWFQL